MTHNITLITGDGTGPEIAEAMKRCVEAVIDVEWDERCAGTAEGVCDQGICDAADLDDDTDCDDGNPCTDSGACLSGVCGSTDVANETKCDDSFNCTEDDACTDGVCAGLAIDCSGLDQDCIAGVCDPLTGTCEQETLADGVACEDGALCTTSDSCETGVCVSGTELDCSGLDVSCNAGLCDPSTGACALVAFENETSCDDGDPCTYDDGCRNGACLGFPKYCGDLDDACVVGVCNASNGECITDNLADESACDDGDECTVDEACTAGICGGGEDICPEDPVDDPSGSTPDNSDGCSCASNNSSTSSALMLLFAMIGWALVRREKRVMQRVRVKNRD